MIAHGSARENAVLPKLFQHGLKKGNIKIKMALSGEDFLINQIAGKLKLKIVKSKVDAKFFIIDRKEILFYISKEKGKEDVAIWLNSEFFSGAFASLFERTL